MLFIIIFGTLSFRTGRDNLDNGLFNVEWLNQHGALQRNRYWARCTQYVTIRSVSGKAGEGGHATANAKSHSAVCRRPARP